MSLALAPALEAHAFAAAYAARGRVHIPGLLTDAAGLHTCLAEQTPYELAARVNDDTPLPLELCLPSNEERLLRWVQDRSGRGFSFLFDAHTVSEHGEPYARPIHGLAAVTAFLNSAPLLDFVRGVTAAQIDYASCRATRFRPGHFLTAHRDGKRGVVAYVLNLTPHWQPGWGGALMFGEPGSSAIEGWLPAFNALNLFAVPQTHWVEPVAPFAAAPRLSITGWFRKRP